MKPIYVILASLLLLAAPLYPQEGEFFERIDVDVVNVEVFVTDRQGQPVTGLEEQDFELLVDGRPVTITNFYAETGGRPFALPELDSRTTAERQGLRLVKEPDDQRLHLAVLIDNLHLRPIHRKRAFRHLREFFATRLSPEDVVTIISFNRSLWIHNDFVDDRRMLERILDQIEDSAATDFAAMSEERRILRELAEARSPRANLTFYENPILTQIRAYAENRFSNALASIEALDNLLRTLSGIPGRKALLHLSDGIATRPGEALYESWREIFGTSNSRYDLDVGSYDLLQQFRRLGRTGNASRVTFYAFDAVTDRRMMAQSVEFQGSEQGILPTSALEIMDANARETLELTATTTGGRRVQISPGVGDELARIAGDFGTYYSLGFRSQDPEPGTSHRIEVKLRRKAGLRLRHRETYEHKGRDERSGEAALAALLYNTGAANPLAVRLRPGALEPRADGASLLAIQVEVPIANLVLVPRGEVHAAQLSFFVSVKDRAGGARPVQKLPFHLNIPADKLAEARGRSAVYDLPLVVRPGDLQAVIGVRDDFADEESALRLELASLSGGG